LANIDFFKCKKFNLILEL